MQCSQLSFVRFSASGSELWLFFSCCHSEHFSSLLVCANFVRVSFSVQLRKSISNYTTFCPMRTLLIGQIITLFHLFASHSCFAPVFVSLMMNRICFFFKKRRWTQRRMNGRTRTLNLTIGWISDPGIRRWWFCDSFDMGSDSFLSLSIHKY